MTPQKTDHHNLMMISTMIYVLTRKERKDNTIGLMQKSPPIFKKMVLNDVALLWMRGFHAYDTASVSS